MPDTLPDKLKSRRNYIEVLFISIKFNSSALKGLPGFENYDYDSRWNIQIEIFNKVYEEGLQAIARKAQLSPGLSGAYEVKHQIDALNKRKEENRLEDLAIRRHKENGEIPDFRWRMYSCPPEYHNNVIKAKK